MDRPPEVNRLDYVTGQVHALKCFCMAVATVLAKHPDLRTELEAAGLVGLAQIESTRAGDKAVKGFQEMMDALQAAAQPPLRTDIAEGPPPMAGFRYIWMWVCQP